MNSKGILFVVSGSSGVGKGTINKAVLSHIPDIKLSISATTRPMRNGEVDGRDYFFINDEEFDARINNNEFLECAEVYSHRYGTPKKEVQEQLSQGYDILLEIDIQGASQVKKQMPEGVFIFIQPPSVEELAARIYERGQDSLESIQIRLNACHEEMNMAKYYDYVVINDQIEAAVNKVQSIIIAERCRVKYY